MADITQHVTSSPSTTLQRTINTPAAILGTSSRSTLAPGETLQTHSIRHVVSSPTSSIASTPISLTGLESLPTPIRNAEVRAIITNPLRTQGTEKNQRQRQLHLQPQAVSTPRIIVSGNHRIHRSGHSDVTHLVFATDRLLELYM
jgi:hypothetical protein